MAQPNEERLVEVDVYTIPTEGNTSIELEMERAFLELKEHEERLNWMDEELDQLRVFMTNMRNRLP